MLWIHAAHIAATATEIIIASTTYLFLVFTMLLCSEAKRLRRGHLRPSVILDKPLELKPTESKTKKMELQI